MEASGDHQGQDQPQVIIEADGDSFADSAQLTDRFAFNATERRIDASQQKGADEPHMLEREFPLPDYPRHPLAEPWYHCSAWAK